MDVRAADTSNLAAKRLELDNVRPVGQKSEGVVDQRQVVRPTGGVGDGESEQEPEEDLDSETVNDDQEQDQDQVIDCHDGENSGGADESHILDVRV